MSTPETGRDYQIDYWDVFDILLGYEDTIKENLSGTKRESRAKNIDGVMDYVMGGMKSSILSNCQLSPKEIRDFPREVKPDNVKRLGVLFFFKYPAAFDLVNFSNKAFIKRETPVVEVVIPRVDFSKTRGGVLRPGLMSKSLDLMANYLQLYDPDIKFVMGLTHPRIGKMAKRWNLLVEEHPFPKEVYQFLEMGLKYFKDEEASPQELSSLEAFKNQVLIYQPRSEFIQRVAS